MTGIDTMGGPLLYLGLWSPGEAGADLLDRTVAALRPVGATVRERHARDDGHAFAVLRSERLPTSPPGGVHVSTLPAEGGALVEVLLSGADLDILPAAASQPLVAAMATVVLAVRPALATFSVEASPDRLPNPTEDDGWFVFTAGWVDLEACNPRQRAAFERMRDAGRAEDLGPGIWWGVNEGYYPHPVHRPLSRDIADEAYRAWMRGRREPVDVWSSPPASTTPDQGTPDQGTHEEWTQEQWEAFDPVAESSKPQLWFWSADGDPQALAQRVRSWLADDGYLVVTCGQDDPQWQPVIAHAPPGTDPATLLAQLRVVAGEVGCSWAGLQPTGGLAVPGLDPSLPQTGIVCHPWVDRAWIGDLLPDLDAALAGAAREEVDSGVLWITSPALGPVTDPGWSDPDTRWQRWTAAATVLATAARHSRSQGPQG